MTPDSWSATVPRVTDTRWEHSWLPRRAAHPFDHAAALASGHATADEGDVAGRGQGAREDPARRLDELVPARRRPNPAPTLSILPEQLHIGDRFIDAEIEDEDKELREKEKVEALTQMS